jgi:hypothetical protein
MMMMMMMMMGGHSFWSMTCMTCKILFSELVVYYITHNHGLLHFVSSWEVKKGHAKKRRKSSEGFQSVVLLELSLILQSKKDSAF